MAILTLADGNVITLTGGVAGEKRWITVDASKDESLRDRTRGRAFNLQTYRYEAIFKKP